MRIRNRVQLIMGGSLVLVTIGFTLFHNIVQRQAFEKELNLDLYSAARMALELLPPGYHDRIVDSSSVSDAEYLGIVKRFNAVCRDTGLEYLWSLMPVDGKLVFTSGTSPSKDASKGDHAKFFEPHTSPELYAAALATMQPQYQTNVDKWGRIRAVLLPFRDGRGRPFLVGASRSLAQIDKQIASTTQVSLLLGGGVLVLGVLASLLFANSLSRPLEAVTRAAAAIAAGDLRQVVAPRGARETAQLAASINLMSASIQERVRELAESRESLRITLQSIGDAVVATDASGRVVRMNPVAEHLTGFSEQEAAGASLESVFHIINTDSREKVENPMHRVLAEGRTVGLANHTILIARDGTERQIADSAAPILDSRGTVVGVVLVFRDVTEEYARDKALRESRRTLLESQRVARLGTYDFDVAADRWTCTEELDRIFGIGPDFPRTAEGWLSLVRPDYRERTRKHLESIVALRSRFDLEYPIVRPEDGTERWLHGLGEFECDARGQVRRLLGTIQDITEHHRAAAEHQALEAQVQQAQKLESLGVLAGGIAHDFNNLLVAILGNADIALAELSPVSPARPCLQEIEKASHRAADLCKQMLAYSGKGRFTIEPLDLSGLIEEMAHMLDVSISKKAVFSRQLASDLPRISADATQIRQVVMNLIINASEAIGDRSGSICVRTGSLECDRAYLREMYLDESLPDGRYVSLEVSDTGCGMDAETCQRIFEPFFSTKFTGRGLGLAAVLGIVRGHQGALKVYSEPGTGTTFKILFPALAAPVAAAATDAPAGPALPWAGNGLVLLVDDDDSVRALAERMITRLGFETITACDGRKALEVYRQRADDIACVLLDLTMPHMDGAETFRELRRIRPDVRVILSSGYNEQEVAVRFSGKSVAGFIQKPYTLAALTGVFQQVLDTAPESA